MKIKLRLKAGDNKIRAIKTLRTMLDLGLTEAKDIADQFYNSWDGRVYIITDMAFGRMNALAYQEGRLGFSFEDVTILPETDGSVIDLTV